ncbi:MAG: hypothetical protein WDN07_00295 [Actinomycetota bacterium]
MRKKNVVIDSGWDVLGFLPQAKALTGGHISFYTLPIEGYALRNKQDVNLIDIPTVRKFVHDLFYPAPKVTTSPKPGASSTKGTNSTHATTATPSASPSPTATKFNYAHLANGTAVQGSGIPCVN